jgi:CubicO group peptidase (beta-lactamase class C family)
MVTSDLPRRRLRHLQLLSALLLLPPLAAAETPQRVPVPKVAAALQPFVDQHRLAGAVALVATKDKILCLEAVGYSDLEARTPMRTDSMFWIASMTKSMTTTAIMMLVDEGKLNITDPAEKYLPEFKQLVVADPKDPSHPRKPQHPVTVEELLSHTHGMAQTKFQPTTLQDEIVAMAAAPMESEPGTRYKYSNGIDAGARILERLSGMPYAQFMQQRLFTPLGMHDSTFWPDERQVARLARTFKFKADNSGIENLTYHIDRPADSTVPAALLLQYNAGMIPIYKHHYAGPSGGLFSTATDVGRFCQMLLAGGVYQGKRYLSEAAIRQMSAIHSKDLFPGNLEAYGLGWFVQRRAADGHPSVGSYGHRGARRTVMWIDPARQLAMVLMLQCFNLPGKDQEAMYGAFINAAEAMSPVK